MNNLLSYCGLIDSKIRASDKDLPVNVKTMRTVAQMFVAFSEKLNFDKKKYSLLTNFFQIDN
jgi:hypothetical protein